MIQPHNDVAFHMISPTSLVVSMLTVDKKILFQMSFLVLTKDYKKRNLFSLKPFVAHISGLMSDENEHSQL